MLTVRMFAGARDAVGAEHVCLDVDRALTIKEVRSKLAETYPQLSGLLKSAMFARGTTYLKPDEIVKHDDELSMIPSVSGG